eukprot:scaffold2643_cov71-Skeletonema_dohrnii-CCMP3373.AAC.1
MDDRAAAKSSDCLEYGNAKQSCIAATGGGARGVGGVTPRLPHGYPTATPQLPHAQAPPACPLAGDPLASKIQNGKGLHRSLCTV